MNIRFFNIDLNRSFTVELLKKEWRKVAMNTHPDKGGRAEYFKIAMAEYEYLLGRAVGADFMLGMMHQIVMTHGCPS